MVSYKIGVCKVSKDGKDCRTIFKKLSFNGKTSVVIARPKTGRMHQIRVHLQFLGKLYKLERSEIGEHARLMFWNPANCYCGCCFYFTIRNIHFRETVW